MCLASVPSLLYLSTLVTIYALRSAYHVTGQHSDNCVRATFTVHINVRDDVNIDVRVDSDGRVNFDVDVNIAAIDALVTV